MGLDISFNRRKAVMAGLQLVELLNDSDPSEDLKDDLDYMEWAAKTIECVRVPGTNHLVENGCGDEEYIIVRANKWGDTYYPLTEWLNANGIIWDEF